MTVDSAFIKLKSKKIVQILDGDTTFEQMGDNQCVRLPYLTNNQIKEIPTQFGGVIEDKTPARWATMFNLIDYGIETSQISKIIAYFFSRTNFQSDDELQKLSPEEFNVYYEKATQSALQKINDLLSFSNYQLKLSNDRRDSSLTLMENKVNVSQPTIKKVDYDRINSLMKNAEYALSVKAYDSVLTKARTLLEETFEYVLAKKGVTTSGNENIKTLYNLVKNTYNMHPSKENDKRINTILSGLENIVGGVSELRNKEGDAHGQGLRRWGIKEYHARLALNSAVTMSEFILSVNENNLEKSKNNIE